MKYADILTEEILRKLYEVDKLKKAEIARFFNVHTVIICDYMKKFGIGTITRSDRIAESMIGQRFGALVVLSKGKNWKDKTASAKLRLNCQCDCGKIALINSASLKRGLSKSCGCLKIRALRINGYKDISGSFWNRLIKGAIARDIEFSITKEQVWEIYEKQNKKCAYSGLDIKFYVDSNKPHLKNASVDRIDSTKGYTIDNIQVIHKTINFMKQWLPHDEFIAMCNLVANHKKMTIEESVELSNRTLYKKGKK